MKLRTLLYLPRAFLGVAVALLMHSSTYSADEPAGSDESEEAIVEKKEPGPGEVKFWSAMRLLASNRPDEIAKGRTDLQASADMEFTHAQMELGRYHLTGAYGFKKDARKAANLFVLAAERGNAYAGAAAGLCYQSGTGVRRNEEKAVRFLQAAIADDADYSRPEPPPENTSVAAQTTVAGELYVDHASSARANARFLLGLIEQGRGKLERAHAHFVAAATSGIDGRDGNFDAARQAALGYAFGQGTARDPEKAKEMLSHSRTLSKRLGISQIQNWVQSKWLDDFAAADVEEALSTADDTMLSQMQFDIAKTLANKRSKDYNPREAAFWYGVAAESGQVWAMIQLAFLLGGRELGEPDPAAAFEWWLKAGGEPPKHILAAANLAICYQNGIGVERDPAKAAEIFNRHKHTNYLCHLGAKGAAPATPQSYEQTVQLLEAAAKKGDGHALYLKGISIRDGWDGKPDAQKAQSWFQKAARKKHAGAIREKGEHIERSVVSIGSIVFFGSDELKSAMELYRQAMELGDAEAAANLAHLHQQGRGTPKRNDLAEDLYLKCLQMDPNYATAHNNLAIIYQERLFDVLAHGGGDADSLRASMLASLEESARLGFPLALVNLGRIYSDGKLAPLDHEKAYTYFDQAAAEGLAEAHYLLGIMHENGLGVPVTLTEAAYHFRLAALDGHRAALHKLIDSYFSGRGVDVDWDMAAFWLMRSVQLGDASSMLALADLQIRRGNAKDVVPLLKKFTDNWNSSLAGFACERLSRLYEEGLGVKANRSTAKRYFKRAVELQNGDALARVAIEHFANNRTAEGVDVMTRAARTSSTACFHLGQMYFHGTNVEMNQKHALELMQRASRENHAKAMYYLAAATYNRVPEAPPIDEAIRLAESAEKMGVPEATGLREKLERRRDLADDNAEEVALPRSG